MNKKLKNILLTLLISAESVLIIGFAIIILKGKFQDNGLNEVSTAQEQAQPQSTHANGLFYSKAKKAYVYYQDGKIVTGRVQHKKITYFANKDGKIYGVKNNVPIISQLPELPTGCEMTAVTMLLQYKGIKVTKFQIADQTPRNMNADLGFIGDPYKATGGWVFPKGIAPIVEQYLGKSEDMTGTSLTKIYQKLLHGHPVVVWLANFDGQSNHAVTLTGYQNKTIFYNDPWTGKRSQIEQSEFMNHWQLDERRALSY